MIQGDSQRVSSNDDQLHRSVNKTISFITTVRKLKSVNQSEKLVEFIKGRKNTGKTLGKCIKLNVLVLKNKFPYLKKEGRNNQKVTLNDQIV